MDVALSRTGILGVIQSVAELMFPKFAFGIGSSVNRHIIEGMARVGMGEPFVITRPEEAREKADKFRTLIKSPVLTGIKIDFGGFKVYDVEPPSIPDVMADRPVIVFGKWCGRPQGKIRLEGTTGDRPYMNDIDTAGVVPSEANSALRYLWARHRVAILSDYNRLNKRDERVKEVTNLGLTYNLLTAYTSFVAIDKQVRLKDGQAVTVKQPLPLPQGVSDYAVGNRIFAAKGMSLAARSSGVMPMRSKERRESLESEEKDYSVSELAIDTAASGWNHIQIGKVEVSEGMSKGSVRKTIEKNISSINCML